MTSPIEVDGVFYSGKFPGSFRIFLFQDVTMEGELVTSLGDLHHRKDSGVASCISRECHTGQEESTLANILGEICLN